MRLERMKHIGLAWLICQVILLSFLQTADAVHRKALGSLGSIVSPFTQQQEIYAGAQLDSAVREQYTPTANTALQAYVTTIGNKIAAQSTQAYPFSFTVLEDDRVANAFSGPGGFIYITTGLLNILENEAQLAAVLSHEIGHVVRRHIVQQMQQRNAADLALTILGRITDVNTRSRLARLGEYLLFQEFSRQDEYEADITGLQLMVRTGYSPQGMVQLLNKLNAMESRGIVIPFLRSHPTSQQRASVVSEYIERNQLEKPGQLMDTRQFHQVIYPR